MRRYFPLIAENAVVVAALMGYEYGNYSVFLHVTFPPVSYTHLDVYKRQIISRPTEHTAVMASSFSIERTPFLAASIIPASSVTGIKAPDRPPTLDEAITCLLYTSENLYFCIRCRYYFCFLFSDHIVFNIYCNRFNLGSAG